MVGINRFRSLTLIQSGFFLLLIILLLLFGEGTSLIYGSCAFALLIGFHLFVDYRMPTSRPTSSGFTTAYIVVYLLLCTLVVWTTRGNDESPYWIVFFLPIIIAASNLSLKATLTTCGATLLMFVSHLPPRMYLGHKERVEELPELFGFIIMFFMVGILVYTFASQHRRQLDLKQQLNERLLENQQSLKNSLELLEVAESSLRTKERLASLGELSAGIAHEIRNPLGIISSSAQLLEGEIASMDARQLLDIIQEESAPIGLSKKTGSFLSETEIPGNPATRTAENTSLTADNVGSDMNRACADIRAHCNLEDRMKKAGHLWPASSCIIIIAS